jgi:hypothetical protein
MISYISCVVKLDGRLPHQVTPVTSGVRYALYWFKHYDRLIDQDAAGLEGVHHGAPYFFPAQLVG